jgi:hypothetical protein
MVEDQNGSIGASTFANGDVDTPIAGSTRVVEPAIFAVWAKIDPRIVNLVVDR